jgi:hypothetical protein
MVSSIIRRSIQLRAAISVGCDAIGTSASIVSGVFAAPDPGMHAAHGIADDEPQMLDAEAFLEQAIMRVDHVLYFGNAVFMPSNGFDDLPWPMPSGTMM